MRSRTLDGRAPETTSSAAGEVYVLLSGAKCNVGDFLIVERACALLRSIRPDRKLEVLPAWKPLDPLAEPVRSARAILIPGGPGYQRRMVPEVYPLCDPLDALRCPVIPLGVGWKGRAGDRAHRESYRFSKPSLAALRWMSGRTRALGCRDPFSVELLRRHGIPNVELIGCPVWYDLSSLGRGPRVEDPIGRVVFTPPQSPRLARQSVAIAARVAQLFPAAERFCCFHRGFTTANAWVTGEQAAANRAIADEARRLGFAVRDVTSDTDAIRFYTDCALHVGYRLHAHLDFLSRRTPSLLLEEDGRGAGASAALGWSGVPAFRDAAGASRLPVRLRRGPWRMRPDQHAPDRLEQLVRKQLDEGFRMLRAVSETIDAHYAGMRDFLERLP